MSIADIHDFAAWGDLLNTTLWEQLGCQVLYVIPVNSNDEQYISMTYAAEKLNPTPNILMVYYSFTWYSMPRTRTAFSATRGMACSDILQRILCRNMKNSSNIRFPDINLKSITNIWYAQVKCISSLVCYYLHKMERCIPNIWCYIRHRIQASSSADVVFYERNPWIKIQQCVY